MLTSPRWGYFNTIMSKHKLTIKIITLFPKFIENFVESFGIVKRAIKLKLLEIKAIDLRKFGLGQRQVVDDRPYGGGVGMVLRADVLLKAILATQKFQVPRTKFQTNSKSQISNLKSRIILLTPQGKKFSQNDAKRLSKYDQLILVCGRYEGFDERIRSFVDEEISLGDYVLMGGELPALTLSEAVMRLRSGILGKDESSHAESFSDSVLEYPQYTKPEALRVEGRGLKAKTMKVPKVLLTGHHKNIENFRKEEAVKRTKKRRPDLFELNKNK